MLSLAAHGGAAAARNAGIGAARSDWIAFLDADDEWGPRKIEKQLTAISSHPGISFVFCASDEFSVTGEPLGDTFRNFPVTCGDDTWRALLATNFVATPTVIARRDLLWRLGGFDESLKVGEDQDMWIRLALEGPTAYVPESLAQVHVRRQSISTWTLADQCNYTLPMIEGHLARLGNRLTPAERRAVRGARIGRTGRIACAHGQLRDGLVMILRSALLGYEPLKSLFLLVRIPFAAFLRRLALMGLGV
jgi:glycosyltransferase involved in cell wall biosynthesis